MSATFVGVRHHSPACARLVAATIERLRPAYVLIEGPADFNDRLDELLLGHQLPVAIFTSFRDGDHTHGSWSPFCEYSPEWVALTAGHRHGAGVRFIDLPAWHPALHGLANRYADAELRYAEAVERLCRAFGVDNVDTLWDHLFEAAPEAELEPRLAAYFDLLRGESAASAADAERESYMASWVLAALADAGDRPVVVVSGGFHRPALIRLAGDAGEASGAGWPATPRFPDDAVGGSFLVPYSFKRLDAFDGYQSGLPSPGYYQHVWEAGLESAAQHLVETVVRRLRQRGQPVSTADLIGARTMAGGLATLRGHRHPTRTDVLDGLVSALVTDALDLPLPWAGRGTLAAGTDPVVVEMVAALSGERVGRLHPETPMPPLVHHALAELERVGQGEIHLNLMDAPDQERSWILHRLRVLGIAGVERLAGPGTSRRSGSRHGADGLDEVWRVAPTDLTLPTLIEAGAYGVTLADAAGAALADRAQPDAEIDLLALIVVDAAACGLAELAVHALERVAAAIGGVDDLGPLGQALAIALGLWRHDRLLGAGSGATALGAVIGAAVGRVLWLVEGIHGAGPADLDRLRALVAVRDAVRHATAALAVEPAMALATMGRLVHDQAAPPDLRGAALGFGWSLGAPATEAERAARGAASPAILGDWLAGLFALAREEVLADAGLLAVLDEIVKAMPERDFLVAVPALRQAFTFFPPREKEAIAQGLLDRRGLRGSARSLLRLAVDPAVIAAARELETRADEVLTRTGLLP